MDNWAKQRYLDASAIVKILIDEGDHHAVRTFFNSNTNFGSTSLCVGEALGVIKAKWKYGRISAEQYFNATRHLVLYASKRIEVEDIGLFTFNGLEIVQNMAKKHALDISDALQLVTILHGKYSGAGPNSSSVLITADSGLAEAARAENIRVWNCIKEEVPPWA